MKYIPLIFMLIFSSCSVRNYEKTESKIIIIKSPKIKFADLGYIRSSDKRIELELFIAGKVVDKISINHLICVKDGCMSKRGFNEEYLHFSYPDDTLQNILLARAIYDGKNIQKNPDGFKQNIKNEYVDILYKVTQNITYFKDRKNRIIFKIKNTELRKNIE
ncbi:MAG: hypothetical protein L3J10_05720 [Sulfurimonas sp.]|nr:hypothetical protein [Campylobacteraceae bacterium]MCF6340229.1 hypothetical protein [Sulfurimonas sp.]